MRIEQAPDWFIELCRKKRHKTEHSNLPVAELDTDKNIKRATDYLAKHAPTAIEGEGGNDTTYKVAARVREFGISEPLCFELMSVHWNEAGKAEPPWDAQDLEQVINNAYRYSTAPWGGMSGLSEFGDATQEFPDFLEPEKKKKLYWLRFSEAADKALESLGDPLIKGVLLSHSMTVLYGPSNSGKTFLGLDLSAHIATGEPWDGHKTTKGLVVYVAAEGGRGILKRVRALRKRFEAQDMPLAVVPCPINLLDSRADIKELLALTREAEEAYGQPCRLLVIDTLSRALSGGDENASTDMGAMVKNLDAIRKKASAAVLVVHHSGKDAARGARGHSLLRAATDTEIEISENTIRFTKQRDIEPIKDVRFKLEPVELGKDEDGDPVSSATIRLLANNEFVQVQLSPLEERVLDAFLSLQKAQGDGQTVSGADVRELVTASGTVSKAQYHRALVVLMEQGWLKKVKRGEYVVTEPPSDSQEIDE